ncbi:hypothetical protein Syun_029147 [Stephania yunnanensis]|uniref:Uncharacterized protein n=1 Tax=Stephania yunnanensis TaxID=152371 RepID=A0AAP0ECP5_9MAGN
MDGRDEVVGTRDAPVVTVDLSVFIYMARGKFDVSMQEVDGEQTRTQHRSEAATFASLYAPADCAKRREQTASYLKEKKHATQIYGVSGRRSSRDDVKDEASYVPIRSRSTSGAKSETTTSQRQTSGGSGQSGSVGMGRPKRLVTRKNVDAMPGTGTFSGRRIPKTTSYRKSKKLPRVTNVVDAEASSAHSFGFSSSDSSKEERDSEEESDEESKEGVDEGEVEGKPVGTGDKEKGKDEEGEDEDSKGF